MSARSILVAVAAAMPAGRVKNGVLRRLGWFIGRGVRLGPCLVLSVDEVRLGDGAFVGPFNVMRELASLTLDEHARIGQWNWITASRPMREAGGAGRLHLGAHSSITARHYVDCTGGIRIGTHTTVAGIRSTLFTHGISWKSSTQTSNAIDVGSYCLISSNVTVAPGSVIGDRIVVGMGATVAGQLSEPGLYMQPRATLVKTDLAGSYFDRERGFVEAD
ncbi:hypothetical protein CIW49_15775 [Mycolicibacterium sp. P1-18]|uniref:acyltransferase n=1 Tax=Mycolicibacterium sp. P1-18 TaxID=2024615 RepID=UPI0011F35262|nr:hypothetical protein [Mycolicibacterium sp. P1-18]KAA0098112.1 hypothetical protein CIW49_15775 [Mycolicibacterium sp. P1-18]